MASTGVAAGAPGAKAENPDQIRHLRDQREPPQERLVVSGGQKVASGPWKSAGNPFRQPLWRAGIGRFVQAPGRLRTIRSHWMLDTWHVSRDTENTIKSFRHKGLKRMFENGQARLVNPSLRSRVENILAVLDASPSALDLATPGNRLHELTGDQAGVWSVAVSGNWRIVFRFTDGNAYDVDLVDYH
jgi:proteic killer suppression protein